MTAFDFETVQGNTPVWADTLTYSDGSVANLTGATLSFIMRSLVADAPLTLTGVTTSPSPTTGAIQFAATATDTAAAGQYMAQWKVVFAGGAVWTFPTVGYLSICIHENLVTVGGAQLVSVPDVKQYLKIPANNRNLDAELIRYIHAARPIVENITGPIIPTVFDEWHAGGGPTIQLRRTPSTSYATMPVLDLAGSGVTPAGVTVTLGVHEFLGSQDHPLALVATPNLGTTYSCMVDGIGTITRLAGGGGRSCFPGGESVHVIYRAGQSAVPPNVTEGTLELIRVNYNTTQPTGSGRYAQADEQDTSAPLTFFVPRGVRELLAPGRRHPSIA